LGEYSFYLPDGFYTLALNSTNDLSVVCDSLFPFGVSSAIASLQLVPLGLTPDCIDPDLVVNGFTPALRRGFNNLYQVQLKNNGYGTSQSNMFYVTFPAGITVNSTIPAFVDSLILEGGGTMLSFQIPPMQPQEILNFNLVYYVGLDLSIGEFINISSSIDFPGPDCNPDNNVFTDVQEIMGAFDPNDLLAWPEGTGVNKLITADQRITYRIRFQNVGNYVATHVTLKDVLPEALDSESISGMHASHPYFISMLDNELKVEFRSIYLPDSSSNQEASNGFFEFDIAVRDYAAGGSKIENQAAITFDFNEPIYTNKVFHTLVNPEVIPGNDLVLFPNPSDGEFQIVNPFDTEVRIRIIGLDGNSIEFKHETGSLIQVSGRYLKSGLYFVELISAAGEIRKGKLVIA
jgi:uncharacterized repeat protein (TIGR01451 family)